MWAALQAWREKFKAKHADSEPKLWIDRFCLTLLTCRQTAHAGTSTWRDAKTSTPHIVTHSSGGFGVFAKSSYSSKWAASHSKSSCALLGAKQNQCGSWRRHHASTCESLGMQRRRCYLTEYGACSPTGHDDFDPQDPPRIARRLRECFSRRAHLLWGNCICPCF